MTVRPPRPGEARALAEIHIETWQHAYSHVFTEEFLTSLDIDRRERWFDVQISKGEGLLVVDAGSAPVGFCFFGDSKDERWGEVFAIYVHPDHWGRGHGHRLLSAAERGLAERSYRRALLWVLKENQQARDFYQRQGWTLGRPIRIEEIGGTQVTEVRYERLLSSSSTSTVSSG
jgi:ribosomal protein S18 acetylase RimI-like enzyme